MSATLVPPYGRGRELFALRFDSPLTTGEGQLAGLRVLPTGRLAAVRGDAVLEQSLLLLFSTARGERVMRPDYGCDLARLVFEPNDGTTAGLAKHYVRQAVHRWEPRVKLLAVEAGPDPSDASVLRIDLAWRPRAGVGEHELSLALDLGGGGAA